MKTKKEFFDVFIDRIDFCLSHKYGIYFINCLFEYEESDSDKKKDKEIFLKTVKRAVHIDIGAYTDEDFSEDNKKWKLPFYCYKQPYNSNAYLPKRTNVPKFPFKEEQIAEKQRQKLIRIPVKFSECTGFQIAQYVVCSWYAGVNYIKRDGRTYDEFPKAGGGFCYILQNQDIEKDGEVPIVIDGEEK